MAHSRKKNPSKMAVCLVADHPLAARYLKRLLERKADVELVSDVKELARRSRSAGGGTPILVIDAFTLPSPLAVHLRAARSLLGDPLVLITGRRIPDEDLCNLLFEGVRGYVDHPAVEELWAAIRAVARGHIWVAQAALERYVALSSRRSLHGRRERGGLSPRQNEIVALLQRKLSNKEIGLALGISERTVRFHLQNVFDRLGVRERHAVAELTLATCPEGKAGDEGSGRRTDDWQPVRPEKWLAA